MLDRKEVLLTLEELYKEVYNDNDDWYNSGVTSAIQAVVRMKDEERNEDDSH